MDSESLDAAYERLSSTGPEFGGWLSNHGPMAADALIRIGHEDDLVSWIDEYKTRLDERPRERWRFEETDWQEYLGDPSRLGDWLALFDRQVRSEPWKDLLARWWPRLIPGAPASATHGLIRTGHAVRALLERETSPRREELGQALGYWAARWQLVPNHLPLRGPRPYGLAMDHLPIEDVEGGVRTRLRHLPDDHIWSETVASAREPIDATSVLAALITITDEAVRRYLRWGHGNAVMLVHSATAPRAAALVLPALPAELWPMTLDYVWATSAAIISSYRSADSYRAPQEQLTLSPAEVAAAAADNRDEHVIKFVEVALEAHQRGVAEALAAGARAIELISPHW